MISEIGPLWAKKESRPLIKVCCKCGFVYVVGFVEPMIWLWVSYLVPALNSQWYSQLLALLADMMNGERIKLIVDGAGWHISDDVDLPDNITFEVLPPYSPELNLVEQVWEDVRYNQSRNQVFTENQSLWDRLEQRMKIYAVSPERVKSITNQE